ncbi:hypothetical protein FGSG_04587 [Fusarium graminearum PH-1]|uniref:hypothetical protein n=1 Tax=Gibberella zeae (strain ATCC MYA-4620 / CBS 123657 / FGSC 9075 / NRRL 31084 / PH-1) TaxID=229533 RepID=UPI000023D7C3|nr:hypothetical protein FGSG_04587 [Fusarium graminearum PH-1]ESU08495.1 hypothetical protein FGSG_04587 [Fusarium graminearum PH-1]|eukprot:XP_011320994.1 hypothetical protein FGSG_04587 [Fusarium graminearum PH-1]
MAPPSFNARLGNKSTSKPVITLFDAKINRYYSPSTAIHSVDRLASKENLPSKFKHREDGQPHQTSTERSVDPDPTETEDRLEGDAAADYDPPKQIFEIVPTEPVEEQQTEPGSETSLSPETHSQGLWDTAYDALRIENPDVVGQYELNLIACSRAIANEKHGYAFGRLSAQIQSGSTTSEYEPSMRASLVDAFLEWFLGEPVPRTPENPESLSQQPGNNSEDDEPVPEAMSTFEASLKEIIRGSQHASIPWVASILALEGLFRLLTTYEVNESQSTIVLVTCRMHWYIGISRQLFRAIDQSSKGVVQFEQALINLYKAILSHQIHASVCAFEGTDNRFLKYKDFGPSDLVHLEENIKLQQETLETLNTDSFKSEINDRIAKAAIQKKQDTDPESDEEEGPGEGPDEGSKQLDKLLQALEVTKQPIMNLRDDKHYHFIKLYQWLQKTAEFTKFCAWDDDPNGRVLLLDGGLDMSETELLQLVCHGLSEPQDEDTSGISQPKHVACYFYDNSKSYQNNVLSAIQSLICQVLRAQPFLGKYLITASYELYPDSSDVVSGFYALSMVFYSILRDVEIQPIYFIVHISDDSSNTLLPLEQSVSKWGHEDFLNLIYTTAQVSDKVRWLVSFQDKQKIPASLDVRLDLRITISCSMEVARDIFSVYVASRLADIAKIQESEELQAMVLHNMRNYPSLEPLWFNTALNMVKLSETYWNAPNKLEELMEMAPKEEALTSLYKMALERLDVLMKSDKDYCLEILLVAAIAYRPLLSTEMRELIELPSNIGLTVLIERFLSPFLELRHIGVSEKESVHFVHQSAQTFILSIISSTGPVESALSTEHSKASTRCLNVLIKNLGERAHALSPGENHSFNVYAALYWMRHILEGDDLNTVVDSVELANRFMRENRAEWLEVIASHRKLRDALSMIENMNHALSRSVKPDTESRHYIHEMIQDTGRFIKRHLLWTNESLGDESASDYKLTSLKDSLAFWPSMKPEWLVQAPTFDNSHQTSEHTLHVLKHNDWVRSCVFSPDGRLLVTGSDEKLVRIWDVATGSLQHVFEALDSYAYSVVASQSGPNGRPLLAAYGSEVIMVWDLVTGEPMQPVRGISQDINESEQKTSNMSVRFRNDDRNPHDDGNPHNDTDEDQTAEDECDTIEESASKTDVLAFTVQSIDISPQGDRLVAVSGRNIILWDIPSFTVTGIYEHEAILGDDIDDDTESFHRVKFSPDGKLVAASVGSSIRIQEVSIEGEHYSLPRTSDLPGHSDAIDGLCFSPEGNGQMYLASGSDDTTACIWNLITGEIEVVLKGHSSHINSVSFSPDGTILATASTDSNIAIWKQRLGSWGSGVLDIPDQTLSGHTSLVWSIAFAPDGNLLASAGNDGEARIWEVIEREQQPGTDNDTRDDTSEASNSVRKEHVSPVVRVSTSPDGKTIASGCRDGKICLWNGVTGAWCRTMEARHTGEVTALVFSDDGETLISTSVDESAIVWSVSEESETPSLRLIGHEDWVRGAAISLDGKLAATASDDWNVLLWDISAHASPGSEHEGTHDQPIARLNGHVDYIYSVAFSPDFRQLASAGDDSMVILWDIGAHEDHDGPKIIMGREDRGRYRWRGVVFTPDSKFVLTVSISGQVAVWKPEASEQVQCLGIYNATIPFTTMRIDKKMPNVLSTDSGSWLFDTKGLSRNQSMEEVSNQDPVVLTRPVDSCIGISQDHSLITWKGHKLILLPADFRPNVHTAWWAQGRSAIIGCGIMMKKCLMAYELAGLTYSLSDPIMLFQGYKFI